jgi:hypothetical protein
LLNEIFKTVKENFDVAIIPKNLVHFEIKGDNNLEAKQYIRGVLKMVKKAALPSNWEFPANHYDLKNNLKTYTLNPYSSEY